MVQAGKAKRTQLKCGRLGTLIHPLSGSGLAAGLYPRTATSITTTESPLRAKDVAAPAASFGASCVYGIARVRDAPTTEIMWP